MNRIFSGQLFAQHPLLVIVLAQLFGTSLWFSVNGVGVALERDVGIDQAALGWLTMATQAGFIVGTLFIAITGLADRVRASRLFAVSAIAGAILNGVFVVVAADWLLALGLRTLVGFCLAGVYPLGMKLVISWTPQYRGAALAWLVGMLTLGTALPHLLRGFTVVFAWYWPVLLASVLSVMAAGMILRLGEGPHLPAVSHRPFREGVVAFRNAAYRRAALGYFGHCWELYAFWLLAPLLVTRELLRLDASLALVAWLAFGVIGLGILGCVLGGLWSRTRGSLFVARLALATSGALCLFYPLLANLSPLFLLALLLLWGFAVIADSPQLSSLAAAAAPQDQVGASLAMMNAIGFALTIPAIFITSALFGEYALLTLWLLLPGPILGLWALLRKLPEDKALPQRA